MYWLSYALKISMYTYTVEGFSKTSSFLVKILREVLFLMSLPVEYSNTPLPPNKSEHKNGREIFSLEDSVSFHDIW